MADPYIANLSVKELMDCQVETVHEIESLCEKKEQLETELDKRKQKYRQVWTATELSVADRQFYALYVEQCKQVARDHKKQKAEEDNIQVSAFSS